MFLSAQMRLTIPWIDRSVLPCRGGAKSTQEIRYSPETIFSLMSSGMVFS